MIHSLYRNDAGIPTYFLFNMKIMHAYLYASLKALEQNTNNYALMENVWVKIYDTISKLLSSI